MLIELHSLTSHAPANLNRDDLGRPKSAIFGGANRARVSSQAIKRSIRTSNYLEGILKNELSTRSRQIPKIIYDRIVKDLDGDEKELELLKKCCESFAGAIGKLDSKHELHTSQTVFLTHDEINRAEEYLRKFMIADGKPSAAQIKEIANEAAEAIGLDRVPADGVDMALFGRMTTDKENNFVNVDASMQVAHAISTHAVVPETDWFTTVDDFTTSKEERGSSHIGELEFNSAVFYKYFSCNLPLLVRNMGGAHKEAVEALAAVLDAACQVTPSGKQNTFASHSLADTVLLVRRGKRLPVSLANAFEHPIYSKTGYLAQSRSELVKHYANISTSYSLDDEAAFFCVDPAAGQELAKDLPEGTKVVSSLSELFNWLKQGLNAEEG